MGSGKTALPPVWRRHAVLTVLFVAFGMTAARVVHLQMTESDHLRAQGDSRYLRDVVVLPQRGRILDRNGQVLSVSTPVSSIWAEPARFCASRDQWKPMLELLKLRKKTLLAACERRQDAEFMYVKRRLVPSLAEEVMALNIPGLEVQREYKRYYPGGPVSAHLVGFTNVDDQGQEGLERFYNDHLSGKAGKKRVLKDLKGHYVETVESIRQVDHGRDLVVSIDQRIQSMASAYLEQAVTEHNAAGGSVVVLSIPSGEILAMVNSPQFNPNDRSTLKKGVFRNRAVTDIMEPGSTAKPFTVAMALESGKIGPETLVETSPGYHRVGGRTIHDVRDYGEITVFDVIAKSSNVGSAKIALAFPFDSLYDTYRDVGFGSSTRTLPDEISGSLYRRERAIEHATMSYGYGFSATPLQLARAYTTFATDGTVLPVTLEKKSDDFAAQGSRIFSPDTVFAMRPMLEKAASAEGTASRAVIPRYRVGGKTGTTHKLINGNYNNNRYQSVFAGIAPLSNPQFVMVVMVDDPRGKRYYGGDVAAPVFSALMKDLVRLYNVKPDKPVSTQLSGLRDQSEATL
ncbi:MAG: penicillin-binding protein 2 [Pseudomonadota bacterium]